MGHSRRLERPFLPQSILALKWHNAKVCSFVTAVASGSCQPVLLGQHMSADHCILSNTRLLYPGLCERQTQIVVFAAAKGCCQPGLQSSTRAKTKHSESNIAAILELFIYPGLYERLERQTSTGVTAMAEVCCQTVLKQKTENYVFKIAPTL